MAFAPTASVSQSDRLAQQQALVFQQMKSMMDAVTNAGRTFTDSEEEKFNDLKRQHDAYDDRRRQATSDENLRAQFDAITGGPRRTTSPTGHDGSSPGALFAAGLSDFVRSGGHRVSGAWRSPSVDVPYASLFATVLSEDVASGGKLVIPTYRDGILPTPTRPIVIMDLLMPGVTDSNAVIYLKETQFTNSASPVLEATAKPESALAFDQVSEPVLKVAHWLPVTEELLEDQPAIASYVDGRLRLGVQLAEDDQLLNGNGTPPNYRGILNRALATTIVQAAGENVPDAVLRQVAAITTTAVTAVTGIVMNPVDWFALPTMKTTTGEYIGLGPFGAVVVPTMWGLPVAVTSAIAAKTALVGAFATMAQFFRKGGIRVEASNSHQDFFVKNLVAIRAEERGALAVYRPGAFGKVTLL